MNNKALGYIICETASSEPQKPNIIDVVNTRAVIRAILQDLEVKNRNGRWYSLAEFEPQLRAARTKELLANRALYGENGHPMSKDLSRQQTIDPNNLSHLITALSLEGNDVVGIVEAATTRVGDDFNRMILEGKTKVAFSLRALGTVQQTNKGAEVHGLRIITWDHVIYPSHTRAYQQEILQGGNSVTTESGIILSESSLFENGSINYGDGYECSNGIFTPIQENMIKSFIKDKSNNMKEVVNSLEFLYESVTYKGNRVELRDNSGNVLCVRLEQHIQDMIMNECSKY